MKSTALVAMLVAHFGASYAQGNCTKDCRKIDVTDATNPCGLAVPWEKRRHCECEWLFRAKSFNLYRHKKNTKVEIYPDNVLHLWCHNSGCWRFNCCRILITYLDSNDQNSHGGNYELPGYNDCCQLPKGFIALATMFKIGY